MRQHDREPRQIKPLPKLKLADFYEPVVLVVCAFIYVIIIHILFD